MLGLKLLKFFVNPVFQILIRGMVKCRSGMEKSRTEIRILDPQYWKNFDI
jgi:hypothetical protein